MKYVSAFWMCFLFFISAHAQTFDNAVKYNDFIVSLQNDIGRRVIQFNDQVASENLTKELIQPYLDSLVITTRTSKAALLILVPFEGETGIRDSAYDLFAFYESIFLNEYVQMIDMLVLMPTGDLDMARFQEIMTSITEREKVLDEQFQKSQQAFADKYNFTLEANELEEQIKN